MNHSISINKKVRGTKPRTKNVAPSRDATFHINHLYRNRKKYTKREHTFLSL